MFAVPVEAGRRGVPRTRTRRPASPSPRAFDGRVLLWCHAGCELDAIVGALSLNVHELFPDGHPRGRRRPLRPVRRADYTGRALHVANVLFALERLGEPWKLQLVCSCPYCGHPAGWLRASPARVDFDCEGGCDSSNFVQALLGRVARKTPHG